MSVCVTCRVFRSTTWIPCSRQPLSTTTALSPSGAGTTLSGILPRATASPTASRWTPVGNGEVKTGFSAGANVQNSAETEAWIEQQRSNSMASSQAWSAQELLPIILQQELGHDSRSKGLFLL